MLFAHQNQGSCQLYTSYSSFCYPFLTQSASCIPSLINRSGLYIAPSVDLQQSESTASQIQSFQAFLSPQCREVALPFLCLYLFPLCDDNQTTYLPSMAQCISISTDICRTEWLLASSLVNNLPVCSDLPNVSPCNGMLHCMCAFVNTVISLFIQDQQHLHQQQLHHQTMHQQLIQHHCQWSIKPALKISFLMEIIAFLTAPSGL